MEQKNPNGKTTSADHCVPAGAGCIIPRRIDTHCKEFQSVGKLFHNNSCYFIFDRFSVFVVNIHRLGLN